MVFGEHDDIVADALQNASRYYRDVVSEESIEEGWHVWTASISTVIESTD